MLVDLILVSLSVPPVFSNIFSTSYENTKYGKVTEGHGILYSTIVTKEEGYGNGYFYGQKFFLGYKKWNDDVEIKQNFNYTEEDDFEIVSPPKSDEEDFILDDEVLNMDAVKRLAYGDISPFDFMKKFPVTEGEDPGLYYLLLPNDYAVRIEFSDDTVNLIYLEDNRLGKSLDLHADPMFIDMFLLERGED